MRVIKLAALSFMFLFLLVTGISLFIPSRVRISKAVNIHATFERVYTEVSEINNWKNWHPALKDLPAGDFGYPNDSSLQIGNDFLKIIKKDEKEVITEITSEGGRPLVSGMKLIVYSQVDSLSIQWYMDFKLRWYPWEKFRSLFYENIYGIQMEQGLSNLKLLAETRRLSIN